MAKKLFVNANGYVSEGVFPVAPPNPQLVPPLFDDYSKQRIYFPTPVEHSEGLGLAKPTNMVGNVLDALYDECLHMRETINCLHEGEELIQLVAVDSVTGAKVVAPMVEAGEALGFVSDLNHKGFDIYINLNPLKIGNGLKPYEYKFAEATEGFREATADDVKYIKYFIVEVEPIEVVGDDSNCEVDAHFERVDAEAIAWYVLRAMKKYHGFKTCFMAYDGKSYNLIWRVNLPATKASEELLSKCLLAISSKFATDSVRINAKRSTALQWVRLYGTINLQTKNTEKHPIMGSHIVHAPVNMKLVETKKLESLAAMVADMPTPLDENLEEMRNRIYSLVSYKNEKAEVVKAYSNFIDEKCRRIWSAKDDAYFIQFHGDEEIDVWYELVSDEFIDRMALELGEILGKEVHRNHVLSAVVTTDSLYRVRDDMAKIRKYISRVGKKIGLVAKD